jgi:cysteine-rich repeat protein
MRFMIFVMVVFLGSCTTKFKELDADAEDAADGGEDEADRVDVRDDGDVGDWDGGDGDCGNGVTDTGEDCDDGNGVDGDGCDTDCTYSCTTDGECQDDDACNGEETCNLAEHACFPGTPQPDGFVCVVAPRSICLEGTCGLSACGDGYVDEGGGEFCDPPGGACTDTCTWSCTGDEDCPDNANICDGDEYCDTGANECGRRNPPIEGTPCGDLAGNICIGGSCQASTCGDLFVDAREGEECDDGRNHDDGDGCTDGCLYTCHDDGECDDGQVCNGGETCNMTTDHTCRPGTNEQSTTPCDDGLFCTAPGSCSGSGDCVNGGNPCTDVLACTINESCNEGSDICEYDIRGGQCLIAGSCVDAPEPNPLDHCQLCDPGVSQTSWSPLVCPSDGFACTRDDCVDGGCPYPISASSCLIGGACRVGAEPNPDDACQVCDPGVSQTSWSPVVCPGDGLTCTLDDCVDGGCPYAVLAGNCLIGGTCYAHGDPNPFNLCQACDADDPRVWTGVSSPCDDGDSCTHDDRCVSGSCLGVPYDHLPDVGDLTAGHAHTCTRMSSGGVKCWGHNMYGQLGDATTVDRNQPVDVAGPPGNVVEVAPGLDFTCVRLSSGLVQCWGNNDDGQLGNGTFTDSLSPVQVSSLTGVVSLSAGYSHACARTAAGSVYCWGNNDDGQLGDGTTNDANIPVRAGTLTNITQVAGGMAHTCALQSTATGVWCWGRNTEGQLGDGTYLPSSTPVSVDTSPTDGNPLTGVVEIDLGGTFSCARTSSSGGVKCWGYNDFGQLGDGTTAGKNAPVDVTLPSTALLQNAVSVSAGGNHACARINSGVVMCWGMNSYGQLGTNNTTGSSRAVTVTTDGANPFTAVVWVSAGNNHTCALWSSTKTPYCWGSNGVGQLGTGDNTDYRVPHLVVCN